MQVLDIIILLKVLATHPLRISNNVLNKITSYRIKKLRISSVLAIRIATWFLPHEYAIKYDIPRPIRSPKELLSTTNEHTPEVDIYLRNICKSINDWDVYSRYVHESMVGVNRMHGEVSDVVDSLPFIITARLAYSLRNMYISTSELLYKEYYAKLLDGIDRALINEHGVPVINCISGSNISVFNHGDGVAAIASLLLLISGFKDIDDQLCQSLECSILERYIEATTDNDYLILDSDNSVYYDLKPNATTNMGKCFIYIVTRLLDNRLTIKDMSIFMLYLNMHPCDGVDAGEQDIIHTFTALEAIINIYESRAPDIIIQRYPLSSIANKCLALATYIRSNRVYYNPEFDSIIYKLKIAASVTPGIHTLVERILSVINVMFDNRVVNKSSRLRRALLNKTNIEISSIDNDIPLPPLYRPCVPYYWFYTPVETEQDGEEHPVFEYLIVYSRIYDYVWHKAH